MFSPPKLKTIIAVLTALVAFSSTVEAQQAEYNRRMAAMQQARARAQAGPRYDQQVRVASADAEEDTFGVEYAAPPAPPVQRSAQANRRAPARTSGRPAAPPQQRVAQAPRRIASSNQPASYNRFMPSHARMAQLTGETIVDSGGPIISSGVVSGCSGPGCTNPGCSSCGGGGAYETIVDGGFVDEGYVVDGYSDSCGGSCGDSCGFFGCGNECCDRGGCPPGPCWLSGLGGVLRNGSYFIGATGFENPIFQVPGTDTFIQDSDFGYYAGLNLGLPLCRLSCGLFSGQFGISTVQTSFNGNEYTSSSRDQTFMTRRIFSPRRLWLTGRLGSRLS